MNCPEIQRLLHGYVDGELDLLTSLEIEQHLRQCAACAVAHKGLEAVRAAVKDAGLYAEPPADLANRIQAAVRRAGTAGPAVRRPHRPWLAVAASLAFGVLAGGGLVHFLPSRSADTFLTEELVAGHVRSQLLAGHSDEGPQESVRTIKF